MTDVEERVQYVTGAIRSADTKGLRYDLISPIGLRRLAARYHMGTQKYAAYNWEKGMPASETYNHAVRHFSLWAGGDRTDDHLAGAAWGAFALMHFEETRPHDPAIWDIHVVCPACLERTGPGLNHLCGIARSRPEPGR